MKDLGYFIISIVYYYYYYYYYYYHCYIMMLPQKLRVLDGNKLTETAQGDGPVA